VAKLEGKIAVVTGASSDICQATAERLAMAGYEVYGTSSTSTRDCVAAVPLRDSMDDARLIDPIQRRSHHVANQSA
jgi:NAD(P)-dependent dehydrogenase (short-subunit alcohol dehydrogenase family)